jgi:ABC-type transport system substrate-binding protein/DNA-binding SARP family transcriptional activator
LTVDLRLLGPVELRLGDGPVELGPRKQRAVLAMLALEAGRTVSADHLSQGLWGDEPPASAAKMVQLYVSHLRRVLDGDGVRIVTHGRGYELRTNGGEVDSIRFERLLGEQRPREALALWHGEALADLADEPFAAVEIRRLDDLRLRAAETAIDADLEAGRHADVIAELELLVGEQPLREHFHVQRMLALYRDGRQSEALAAYQDARTALVEQIGVEPGVELRTLHEAVLEQDPALDLPAAPEPVPALAPRPPQPVWRTRRLLVAAAAVLLAGIAAFGVIRVLEPEGLPGIREDAVGVIDPDGARITADYRVGRAPDAVASGDGSVWIASQLDGTVARVTGRHDPVVIIRVGGAPAALAFGAGSLWEADGDGRDVAQIDPGSNTIIQRRAAGNAPQSLAVAAGALWVVSGADGSLHRIEIGGARTSREISLGAKATAVAAGAGAIWVTSEEAGTVTRVNPRSGSVVAGVPVGNGPTAVAAGEGAVWVVNRGDGTLSRVDPAENAVSGLVPLGADPRAVAAGGGAVWVAGGEDGTVARVDPRGLRVKRLKTGSSPSALTVADGSVWTAATAPAAAHRGGTLRVVLPDTLRIPANWLIGDGYFAETWMLTSLAYDGLLAYRRADGVAGATLVGALATRPPPPSRDGRTYVFTLRKGLRYSDGSPVRPGDFRASMERLLRVSRDGFPQYYARIVGARRCVRRPARCDLSRGIESDTATGTITIHLTKPDADFLHKLTLPFAFVVPARTPASTARDLAPPGTGPYRIAAWDSRRGGRLVRNPRFRPTGARPAGFADRIEFTRTVSSDSEKRVAAVERGKTDVLFIAPPLKRLLARGGLRALVARAPGQVHSLPSPNSAWMFLNVRRRPFDSLRVRQAVNLATDRAALVALSGGPELASSSCQVLPYAFPGFEPYCPYSTNPAPGRGWTAPNIGRARKLIAESGRAGATVVVDVFPYERARHGRYFVSLLRRLGFHARLRVLSDERYWGVIQARGSREQMGIVGWGADYMSPSTFIDPTFTCTSAGDASSENASHLCNPGVTRAVARARAATGADAAAAWAAVDRRLVDLAPAVPTINLRTAILVSKRVGNVTHHAQWTTLLEQMWVR